VKGEQLARHLGYPVENPAISHAAAGRSAVRHLAASRPASWLLARMLPNVDAWLDSLSGRRLSATGLLAGLPVITLSTVGARTGTPRDVRLVPVITPRLFAVLGTNFGGRTTPGWVHNLLAHHRATVIFREHAVAVLAAEIFGPDRAELLRCAAAVYPGFGRYGDRAGHRHVHVFALESDPVVLPSAGL